VCLKIADVVGKSDDRIQKSEAGREGIMWATSGGEADATGTKKQIAVDEIHNVINVLEDIENGKLKDIEFVEALSCPGGCVGGPLTVENSFVARSKIKQLCQDMSEFGMDVLDKVDVKWDKIPKRSTAMRLDDNIFKAMEMSNRIDEILDGLPQLDCGSCGSPSCRDLAEDIVRGYASEADCIFKIRERLGALAREMMEIESHAPRSSAVEPFNEKE
ncbi:MAG: ferredoxin, partial [Clostridia bacterium]|nr:ferredoxin [Clostridia bacterium]